jgi:CRISPR/Cas system CMR subunit Cmr4 (Cas7 group RAMP superfamily)
MQEILRKVVVVEEGSKRKAMNGWTLGATAQRRHRLDMMTTRGGLWTLERVYFTIA